MVASLLKIISTGMQDERLQPPKDQASLDAFRTVIPKCGRYGTQWSRIDFDTLPNFGTSSVIRIPTQGEMVGRILLVTQMPDILTPQSRAQAIEGFVGPHFSWTNSLGHAVINTVSLSIGGTVVDTIPGRLMEILDEFQTPLERQVETSRQLCRQLNGFGQTSFGSPSSPVGSNSPIQTVTTLLPFWFSRGDPGCLLPIDALHVDEVRLTVQYNPITSVYYTDSRQMDSSGKVVQTSTEGGSLWPLLGSEFYAQSSTGAVIPGLEPRSPLGQVPVLAIPGITMPQTLSITNAYLLVEYIYLDKPEANRVRIADIQVPIVQHYTLDPVDNQNNPNARMSLIVPNPTRDIFFYCQRYEAAGYNAHFLASRDLSSNQVPYAPWWPDVSGLLQQSDDHSYGTIRPGFSTRFSEPIRWLSLDYSETLNRYSTENVAIFRSLLPSIEQRKAPFVNRYFYNLPLSVQNGFTPFSRPMGEANLDKILRINLSLGFHGKTGQINDDFVDRYITRVYAETYNILRIYGGRGSTMFAY